MAKSSPRPEVAVDTVVSTKKYILQSFIRTVFATLILLKVYEETGIWTVIFLGLMYLSTEAQTFINRNNERLKSQILKLTNILAGKC